MISERYLSIHGYASLQAFYDETTEYLVAGKFTQARNNVLAMSKEQRKEYFFKVIDLYPNKISFLEFIMALI